MALLALIIRSRFQHKLQRKIPSVFPTSSPQLLISPCLVCGSCPYPVAHLIFWTGNWRGAIVRHQQRVTALARSLGKSGLWEKFVAFVSIPLHVSTRLKTPPKSSRKLPPRPKTSCNHGRQIQSSIVSTPLTSWFNSFYTSTNSRGKKTSIWST